MKRLVVLFAVVLLSGCQTFLSYCAETEARSALRKINPIEQVTAGVFGACAAAQILSEDLKEEKNGTGTAASED